MDPWNNFQMTEGPSLNIDRLDHSCGKMQIDGKTILVVAGGFRIENNYDYVTLNSVELLYIQSSEGWKFGMIHTLIRPRKAKFNNYI